MRALRSSPLRRWHSPLLLVAAQPTGIGKSEGMLLAAGSSSRLAAMPQLRGGRTPRWLDGVSPSRDSLGHLCPMEGETPSSRLT